MKLSSLPADEALRLVVAAAIKWGPTRVSRISYETDIPLETCRYYLKRYHNLGYRFFPVVDYQALGLQPMLVFLRLAREWRAFSRETNFVRWLEKIYATYRAGLRNQGEYMLHVAVPKGDEGNYKKLLEELTKLGVLENYTVREIRMGYYLARWIRYYDFFSHTWRREPLDIRGYPIPITANRIPPHLDEIDLRIIVRLEMNPRVTNLDISRELGVSPQLISYHRQKHVEGQGLITGYIPGWNIEPENWLTAIKLKRSLDGKISPYNHLIAELSDGLYIERIHMPPRDVTKLDTLIPLAEKSIMPFGIPIEHYNLENKEWMQVWMLVKDELSNVVKQLSRV